MNMQKYLAEHVKCIYSRTCAYTHVHKHVHSLIHPRLHAYIPPINCSCINFQERCTLSRSILQRNRQIWRGAGKACLDEAVFSRRSALRQESGLKCHIRNTAIQPTPRCERSNSGELLQPTVDRACHSRKFSLVHLFEILLANENQRTSVNMSQNKTRVMAYASQQRKRFSIVLAHCQ